LLYNSPVSNIVDRGLPISDNSLYSWHSLFCGMTSRPSFGIVSSIGAVLLLAIWPNILPLQQHLAMAQIVPGAARVPTFGSVPANTTTAAGAPANTTTAAGAPANTTTAAGAPANTTAAAGAPANTTAAGAPANTTAAAGAPANTTAAGAPGPGDPAGEEVVPHWYGGTPCHDEIESNCAK
jgi:hypothetical protein